MGIALLASPVLLLSQQPGSALIVAATSELPEAPQPQFELAAVDELAQQTPAAQSQSIPQPASSVTPAATSSQSSAAQSSFSSQAPAQQHGAEKSQHDNAKQQTDAPEQRPGSIGGTVTDVYDDIIPGATVVLKGPVPGDRRTVVANGKGSFSFDDLKPGTPYYVTISGQGFVNWTSPEVILKPGEYIFLTGCQLKIAGGVTSVTVHSSSEQIAIEQVKIEEQQRIFGVIPNFYVVYDRNAVPLTTKLKFKLAYRISIDPVSFAGAAFLAGINQAARTPDYVLGAKGYGQRIGAVYADGFTDIMVGGAILPSLLHQDPRYFYQGTGTKKSRALHAISNPFICKGDNGRRQPNYSTIGGDLASAAISNAYYPAADRGVGLEFKNFSIDTGERLASTLIQEFVLSKFTSRAKNRD